MINREIINKKLFTIAISAFLMLSFVLAAFSLVTPLASAVAASITLSSSQGAAGSSVNVTGTGFAANSVVGIGLGGEVAVAGESLSITAYNNNPSYEVTATTAKTPIKPGTFSVDAGGIYTTKDNGVGLVTTTYTGFISGSINYVTGLYDYYTGSAPFGGEVYTANYTTYGYNLSPGGGINTNAAGSFTAKITIPNVSNGNYTITAISATGNVATSTFTITAATPILAITLAPSQGSSGSSVNVTGTMFAANKAVGIGFGTEAKVSSESITEVISGSNPYTYAATTAFAPIKPGTFSLNVAGGFSAIDNGAGALTVPGGYISFISGTINYVTGQFSYVSSVSQGATSYTAGYTTYGYTMSPGGGIAISANGSFTAKITIPNVSNGNYVVVAIDTQGNLATRTFTVIGGTPTPTPSATPIPTPVPTAVPTLTPVQTASPTVVPTAHPISTATPMLSPSPSLSPTVPEFSGQLLGITLIISMLIVLTAAITIKKKKMEKDQHR